jgi:hypothetical protein
MFIQFFYFFGIIFFVHEFKNFLDPTRPLIRRLQLKKGKELSQEESLIIAKVVFGVLIPYIIWNAIGFFTVQWSLFLILFGMGYLKKHLLRKARKEEDLKAELAVVRWDALVNCICLAFIIIRGLTI